MKEVTKNITVYVADDGTEFDKLEDCKNWESEGSIAAYIDDRAESSGEYWEDVGGATIVQWLLEEYTITKK